MIEKFVDDDHGYLSWLAGHPNGYVVNAERKPRTAYLVLHRADCSSINKLSKSASQWTVDYIKVCSDARKELDSWAASEVNGVLQPCDRCKP